MADVTTEELTGQIELSRQRFQQVIDQIRTVVVADVSAFTAKAAKQAFLSQSVAADALDDAQLSALKTRSVEVGESASKRLEAALADDSAWLQGPNTTADERSLEDAAGVWSHVDAVNADVRELLTGFGFDAEDAGYVPPRYFVGGLYLPTLVEHYWRLRGEIATLEGQKESLAAESLRQRLEARWNDA